MSERRFRIVNVFTVAGERLTGNPLCVFEDARGMGDAELQALARQLNLSETTFIFPPTAGGHAKVRIFTPSHEMPFAGHPTLGTAHVVRDLLAAGPRLALEMAVGRVEVAFGSGLWTLRAALAPETRVPDAPRETLAKMLGLPAIGERPLWVDTGAEQLVIPLRSAADVAAARPNAELLATHGYSARRGAHMAYIWAPEGPARIAARFFFLSNGSIVEDPATGSACANLGGWFLATGAPLPLSEEISQGAAVSRPSRLHLHVDEERQIFVSGEVIEVGRGSFFV